MSARRRFPFDDYLEAVAAQTIANEHPKETDLRRAFADLLIARKPSACSVRPSTRAAGFSFTATRATARPASPSASPAASARPSGSPG